VKQGITILIQENNLNEQESLKLIAQLKDGTDQQRRSASYKLRNSKEQATVQAPIGAYADKDSSVRQNVFDGLRTIGTKEAQEFLISQGQSIQSPKSNGNLRLLPIVAGILSLILVAGIGIASIPADVYLRDPNASPGKGIGAIALVVSFGVFYLTKQWVDNKSK